MGYSGGIYSKPILGGFSDVANLYLQGKMQVINIRQQVRQQRSEELQALAEQAAEIEATGVSEIDKLYQQGANDLRQAASDAHTANILGRTNRGVATARVNNYTSQASQLANASTIIKTKVDEMDKEILNGKVNDYSRAKYLRGWFTEQNLVPRYIKIPVDPNDASKGYTQVPQYQTMGTEMIDGKLHYRKTSNFLNTNTGVEEVQTRLTSINEMSNTPDLFMQFDVNDYVKESTNAIGQSQAVDLVPGQPAGSPPPFTSQQTITAQGGNTQIYTRVIAPSRLIQVADMIETDINAVLQDDKKVISILSEYYNARAIGDEGFGGMKDQSQINDLFGETEYTDQSTGVVTKIPQFYDKNGDGITLTNTDSSGNIIDPTIIQLDAYNNEEITDDQRSIVGAILRKKMLNAFNIKLSDFKIRDILKAKKPKGDESLSVLASVYTKNGQTTTTDFDNINTMISLTEAQNANNTSLTTQILQERNTNGFTTRGFNNQVAATVFKPTNEYGSINIGNEFQEVLSENMLISDLYNKKLDKIRGVGFSEDPSGTGNSRIFVTGDVIVAETEADWNQTSGGQNAASSGYSTNSKQQVVSESVSVLEDSKIQRLYQNLYANVPGFDAKMRGLGFTGPTAKSSTFGNSAYVDAIITYIKDKKNNAL
jgi:hypothetical protein